MKTRYKRGMAFALLIIVSYSFAADDPRYQRQQLCPKVLLLFNVTAAGIEKIVLTPLEEALICGDSGVQEWQNIPSEQTTLHLQAVLQGRGYYHVSAKEEQKILKVYVGSLSYVNIILIKGFTSDLLLDRLMHSSAKWIGEILTPHLLDQIQTQIQQQLWREGYACTTFSIEANADTGTVTINIVNAEKLKILSVTEENPIPGMSPKVMSRYHAFHLGDVFKSDLQELTTRRMVSDGIVQSARYTVDCSGLAGDKGVVIKHHYTIGKPRLVTADLGASNEKYIFLRLNWKNVRLGAHGSSVRAGLLTSTTEQRLEAEGNWFPTTDYPRLYIRPNLNLGWEREKLYKTASQQIKLGTGASWDFLHANLQLNAGPVFNRQLTYRGVGPQESNFLTINGFVELLGHDFEYYRASPRDGYLLNFATTLTHKNFLSPLSAYLFSLSGQYLYNLTSPVSLVFGVRGRFNTTHIPKLKNQQQEVPLLFRHFLGGMDDLRGFSRKQLPNDSKGALSSFFIGWEIRLTSFFYEKLQPLVFLDTGWLGKESFKLQRTLYWSPGIGFRLESPIGTFRSFASYGRISYGTRNENEYLGKMQYYLSYGQEF
ncbi:MAG: BamA/TamA family outer membrane protein [Oligoflexia bacterium]|nr:BamA/TamA family outer membrane protein [Oligoflexia bacterium]